MAIGESAGILFKIKGDSSDAVRAFKQTEAAQSDLTGATAGLTSSFSSLAAPALLAGAAITVVATAAIAGVRALFDLTKSTAEFGSTIFDASQKTGLGAQTLSALKFAADQSGSSFEQVTKGIVTFEVELGKMAQGNDKAAAKMKLLGVTSTDTRTALAQVIKTIYEAADANERAALAAAAFGKRLGPDLIPLILDAKGNLDELEKTTKELGVTMTDEAMIAADQFEDQLGLLNAQIDGLGRMIGSTFMPIFLNMARGMSDFFTRNQAEIQAWATHSANFILGLIDIYNTLALSVSELEAGTHRLSGAYTNLISTFAKNDPILRGVVALWERWVGAIDAIAKRGAAAAGITAGLGGFVSPALGGGGGLPTGGGGRGGGGRSNADAEAKRAAREAEQLAARDLAAQIKIEAGLLKTVQEQLSKALNTLATDLMGTKVKGVQAELLKFTEDWVVKLLASLDALDQLEKQQLKVDATDNERAALRMSQDERRQKIKLQFAADLKKAEDDLFAEQLRRGAAIADMDQEAFERREQEIEQLKEMLDAVTPGGLTGEKPSADSLGDPDETLNPFEHFLTGWQLMYDTIMADAPTLQDTLESLGNIVGGAFDGMANAIGHMVQQWVLYGTTAPAIMRKILASALATIAAEAAVRAIYELAMGFASLAVQDYEGAAFHFGSAALFGTIAAVAAIAGRVVAGNAFKQQTATATGGASGNQRSSSSEGGAYSSLPDQTYETGIHSPGIQGQINVKIGLDSDGVLTLLEQNARNNGRFRGLVLRLADGA